MSKFARIIKNNIYADYSPQDLIQENVAHFKGWKCSAGTEGLFIDWDGNIWPATCVIHNHKELLGSINDDKPIKLLNEYITCNACSCPCLVEIYLPKYKNSPAELIETSLGKTNLNDFDAVSRAVEYDKNRKYIMWAFGRKCNFSCSYCDDVSHSNLDKDLVSESAINKVLEYAELFREGKALMWSFTGGEPTINPMFLHLVKKLHLKGDTITVASNGSQSDEYYIELTKYANINISVHFEYLKPNKLKKIVNAIILENPEWVGLNFMIKPSNTQKCMDYLRELSSIPNFKKIVNLHFDILRVKNKKEYEIYSEEEMILIRKLQKGDYE